MTGPATAYEIPLRVCGEDERMPVSNSGCGIGIRYAILNKDKAESHRERVGPEGEVNDDIITVNWVR